MQGSATPFSLKRASVLALAGLVSAALLVTGMTPAAFAATNDASLTGRVLNPAGVAVKTAKVTAIRVDNVDQKIEADADSLGRYTLSGLDSALQYVIRIDTNRGIANSNFVQFYGGASDVSSARPWKPAPGANSLDLKLLGGSFSGKVLNPKGVGLAGVDVHLFKWDGVRWSLVKTVASAASTGAYSFPYLEPGSYTTEYDASHGQKSYISVFAGGAAVYGNEVVPHSIDKATKYYVAIGKPIVVNQKLTVGGTLSGQAYQDGQTLSAGTRVVAMAMFGAAPNRTSSTLPVVPLTVKTPMKFSITGLPTGYYSLSATSMYTGYTDSFTDPAYGQTDQRIYYVKAGSLTSGASVDNSATHDGGVEQLHGSFTPSSSVTGGTVDIGRVDDFDTSQTLPIDADGTFSHELRVGRYTYEARPTGPGLLKPMYGEVVVAAGGTTFVIAAEEETAMGFAAGPTVTPLSGSVGTTFTASAASNHPTTSVVTYQWLRDGIPIFGAKSAQYTAGGGDQEHAIAVRIGISDFENIDNVNTTISAGTIAMGAPIANVVPPSIIAPAVVKVGSVLRASPGTWSESPVTVAYQWMLNGAAITGATRATFTPVGPNGGQDIGLRVTASRAGHAAGTYTPQYTEYVSVAPLPAPVLKVAPKVTVSTAGLTDGKIRYTVSRGTWSPSAVNVTFDWFLDGTPQGSSPGNVLTLDPVYDDMTAVLTVVVTASQPGSLSASTSIVARKSSQPPIADVLPTVVRTPGEDPLMSDSPIRSGDSVSVQEGYWIYADPMWVREVTPLSQTYTWYRGESPRVKIAGATKASYRFTDADNGLPVSVSVLTTSPGMVPVMTVIPAGTGYLDDSLLDIDAVASLNAAAVPLVPVTATVSNSFAAYAPVTLSYQWMTCKPALVDCEAGSLAGYVPIAKATARTYTPPVSFAGSFLGVRVTVGKAGFRAVTVTASAPVGAAKTITAANPTIAGTPVVGAKLTAVGGIKDIPATTSTFVWRAAGAVLGTGATFTPKADQFETEITVVETVKKTGYATVVRESAGVEIGAGVESVASAPVITTVNTAYGPKSTIAATFVPATLAPARVATYEWFLGETRVGGNENTYTRTGDYAGKSLRVTVTFESGLPAYGARTFAETYLVVRGVLAPVAALPIIGSRLGDTLQAPGVDFDYPSEPGERHETRQWYVGGVAIKGATADTYTPPSSASVGKKYTVRVTSTTQYFATVSVLSPALTLLSGLNATGTPTIDVAGGAVKPGAILSANTGSFTLPGQTFSYQWQLNTGATWVNIAKATAKTYKVLPTQVGATLRVVVSGKRAGYATRAATSNAVTAVSSGALPLVIEPSLVGATKAGSVLSISGPTFGVAGVTLSYRWLRNGILVPGATGSSFVTSTGQIDDSITVEITARAVGYTPWVSILDARVVSAG